MAISSIGIGSGLDANAIITQTVALEKQPLTQLKGMAASYQTQMSTYGQVKSMLSTLSDAASKLTLDGSWNSMTATSSNSAAASASVTGMASATSFSMGVQQLARTQSVASTPMAPAGAAVGAGTLSIQLGTWASNGASFTPGTASAVSVTVTSTDTLSQVASKINDANAGVTATVMKDASGERLLLRSKDTGEAAGFRVQAAEDAAAAGLARLGFDPEHAASQGMAASAVQYGQNAKATINGIAITSASNVFTDAIAGVKLTATQVTTTDVDIAVSNDTGSMRKNIQDFVNAYNAVNDLLSSSTKYDADTKTIGVLQGDTTAVGLQNTLRSLMSSGSGGTGAFQRLSDIGIDIQRGGKLTVNASKLDEALKDPASVKTLFAAGAGTEQPMGMAAKFKTLTTQMLSMDGVMTSRTKALTDSIKRNNDEQNKVNDRAAAVEKRLRAQYTALDKQMAQLNALNSYVGQQVAAWNK